MTTRLARAIMAALAACMLAGAPGALAQPAAGPLRIDITEGVIEPLTFAMPAFETESFGLDDIAGDIARVISQDLAGTGLFREIPKDAHIGKISGFDRPVQYSDWKAVNAQALVTGQVTGSETGMLTVKFRLFDVFAGAALGDGLQFSGSAESWRRMAHKVADRVYSRLTGETGYFDSQIAFISEHGPKDRREKRLAIMDYDGANLRYLTGAEAIVIAPRFSPDGKWLLYTSYKSGIPRVYLMDIRSASSRAVHEQAQMTFAPNFTPDGRTIAMSATDGGNTDIYTINLKNGRRTRLTTAASIETAPSYSPDGKAIVFESDRSGTPQLYIMRADGSDARRISFGKGRYGTPVWSPRGDLIAFTKKHRGRFHIGVMRLDGSEERLLSSSFLDEGPTWSPNGRVIMFFRETKGANGSSLVYSVDITGRNLKVVNTKGPASDPAWSPLRK